MSLPIRRFRIPDSRLPFINAEIAQVTFQGQPHLVSSIVGGAPGGRLYFWNPDTGACGVRQLPKGASSAYMIRPASDGRLYLGCGPGGDLLRYDPVADRVETLITGELKGITWGGCVADRYAIWTASPGHVGVYDWREERLVKVFRPIDAERPEALYGHHIIETPEKKVLLAMDVPQARLVILDPKTMTATSHTPSVLVGKTSTHDAAFLDPHTLALMEGNDLHLLRYPGFEPADRVPAPQGVKGMRTCVVDGQLYAIARPGGDLYRLDRASRSWELNHKAWIEGDTFTPGVWNDRDVCAVTVDGIAHRLNPRTGQSDQLDLKATGPMGAHALCAAPDAGLILGAPFINQRFWTIDIATGEGRDCGRAAPGGGQINQIIWEPLTGRALMSSYTSSSVTAYDPTQPPAWPDNPRVLCSAHDHEQMRPMGLAHDGRHVWMATSPEYGHLGGALSRIDPQTGEIRIWRHLLPGQKVNALVLDPTRRRVYCSTDITADANSAPPTQTTGHLVAFDMDALAVLRRQAIRPDATHNFVRTLLPTGEVLAQAGEEFYAWDAEKGRLRPLGPVPKNFREATHDGAGHLYASIDGHVGRLHLESDRLRFEPLTDDDGRFLQVVHDTLTYAAGFEVCAVTLKA
ncbi:MAG: hypothetical protein EXS64_10280 [Candidatus Latescibacteria bacterium]|nr:hypothetical protein [Candidatus Latescibacterota bacterium]